VTKMTRPLNALKALLLMLARRLSRFLRLALKKPFTLPLMPPPRRLGGVRWFLVLFEESSEMDPPTAEETWATS
jgi:hypothetical protein